MDIYLYELGIIHTLLVFGYWFFLRNERQYAKMRFYLIASTLVALIIPFLKLPQILFKGEESLPLATFELYPAESIVLTAKETSFWSMDLIPPIYFLISIFFLYGFVKNIFHLIILERRSNYQLYRGLYIRRVPNIKGSFTFFNWIFLGDEIVKGDEDAEAILKHENAHVKLGHTYDLIFFELFKVCFWWLPTSWFIQKEIKKIHEYQADAKAIKSCDPNKYSSVLINSTLKINGLSLASSFHDGLINKRLKAMKQQVKKVSPWKLGALTVLASLLFIVFACNEEMDKDIQKMSHDASAITFDQLPINMQRSLESNRDKLSFVKIDLPNSKADLSGPEIKDILVEMQGIDPDLVHLFQSTKSDDAIYVALKKSSDNFNYVAEKSKTEGDVFTIVEDQPGYPGGKDAFLEYLAQEIQYPIEARKKGIEGKVYVQFIVDKDGSISNVEPVKGIGGGCDEEAVRVIENAGIFKPGRQRGMPVRVKMVMPIAFKLSPDKLNPDNTTQGMVIIDKASTNGGRIKVNAAYDGGTWKGKVLSPEGDVLPGANVVVEGGTTGTVTDLDGNFQLSTNEKDNLNISFVGYETVMLKGKE